ncbi:MAG TPA: DUF72 domain-containing protein [Chryseolinea sp.]|nr:DUF72 domain-containing protein [Chryseolinea sp.]
MEFGRLETDELDGVDFTLPPDLAATDRILAASPKTGRPEVFVGCAKWGRKDWIGTIYPEKTKEADFLSHYGRHFNCIELNATFYKMPSAHQTEGWASQVGPGFQFSPKFPNQITHMRRLKNVEEQTTRFLKGVSGFGKALGPLFLMPHPQLGPKDLDRLEAFIQSLPSDVKVFVEMRHPEWYADPVAFNNLFTVLERHKAGSIITDASGRRDCVHMRLSTPEAFIRFVGNGLHPTDYTRVDDWVQRIRTWMEKGIRTVYFFMHQHEEVYSPELCRYLIHELNKHCGTNIPVPVFVEAPVRGMAEFQSDANTENEQGVASKVGKSTAKKVATSDNATIKENTPEKKARAPRAKKSKE